MPTILILFSRTLSIPTIAVMFIDILYAYSYLPLKNSMLKNFWKQLASAKKAVLLLDYDGTLAPFRVERDQAFPYPGVRELLTAIRSTTETRLVIITGRAIKDILPLLALDPPPEIWGCHGWERLEASGLQPVVNLPDKATLGIRKAYLSIKSQELANYCEVKSASLAIHWRGFSDQKIEELNWRVRDYWQPIAEEYGLEIHPFNGGLELRCPGKNKGTALNSILDNINLGQPVAFLGDDLTDEDGFVAIKGRGLGILVNREKKKTHADIQISPPDDLLDFLSQWRDTAPIKINLHKGRRS